MSSKRSGGGGEQLYQSSLFRYTKANPRKSAPAAPPRAASSSFKDKTSSTSKTGISSNPAVPRIHASYSTHSISPNLTSTFGSSSSGVTLCDLKENKVPSGTVLEFASSSPIPGLSPSWDQRIIQREKRKAVQRGREAAGAQVSPPKISKRKVRGWELEDHSDGVDGGITKRKRRASSSSSPPSHSHTNKGESPCTPCRRNPQSAPTTTPQVWSSAVTPFNNGKDDIDPSPGLIIESSQTQPLLSPERPIASSLQVHPSSQVSDGGIVRSSQSPSPLKPNSHHSTPSAVEFTFVATPLKASIYPSPSKTSPEITEVRVSRRRRAPEPGTVSMFGVRGAGVSSPPELSLDIESPSTRALYPGVKLIRRPGRYSIPLSIDDKDPTTPHTLFQSNRIQHSPLYAQSPAIPPITLVDQTSSQTPAFDSGGSSFNGHAENQASDPGPFWETQPLLDLDFDEPHSPSTSPPASPSPLPRMSVPPRTTSPGEKKRANVSRADVLANTSGSETEQDFPTPFLPPKRHTASSADPDKTIVAFTPTRQKRGAVLGSEISSTLHRRQSGTKGTVPVPDSSDPAAESDEGNRVEDAVDGDVTMVNHHGKKTVDPAPLNGKVQDGDIRDVTLGLEDLSPFKRKQKHPAAPKQMLRLQDSEVIVIEDDDDDPVGPSLSAGRYAVPQEETQDDQTYTQLWPGTSLPAGWNAFETPKKRRREPRFRFPSGSRSKSFGRSITLIDSGDDGDDRIQDDHDFDDVFGPEVTPQTSQREKPDELKAFEALPSPYVGMFSGNIEGESDTESEV